MPNRLAQATSPYLLQHRDNPVDWWEWGARQLAALVDVAPTTVTRIESGVVSPSFDLAQELPTVLGEPIGFTGVADSAAIATARLALNPALDIAVTTAREAWQQRWARIGLVDASGRVVPGKEAPAVPCWTCRAADASPSRRGLQGRADRVRHRRGARRGRRRMRADW